MYSDVLDTVGFVSERDPEVGAAMEKELRRQQNNIELIASENFVSPAVLAAMGSILTNKYAEGYPGKRYYGGCRYVDIVEDIARDRACKLFGAKFANVQPHSGAQANQAVYLALIEPVVLRKGKDPQFLSQRSGFVLAGMDGFKYRQETIELSAGDEMFFYTDGVTEATNASNELYGNDRLLDCLEGCRDETVGGQLEAFKNDINAFVGGIDQFDDITIMGMKIS